MKRLLPLALLSLLLLAPTARGGDLENIARDIQDVDVQIQYLVDALDQTEDEHKRAELQGQLGNARAHRAKLETERVSVRALLDTAGQQHAELRRRVDAWVEKLTARHNQVLGRRQAFVAKGDQRHAAALGPSVERAEQDLGLALSLQDILAAAEVHLREGALHATQRKLAEAKARLEDLEQRIRALEAMKRAAAAAEGAEEDARRAETADEITDRVTVAEAGISAAKVTRARLLEALERATDPEDVEEVKRIQERMARFEAHAANFYSAQALLKTARSHLEAKKIDEARKALGQARRFLEKAAQQPLDDGSASRPAPEFRTQRAALDAWRLQSPHITLHGVTIRTEIRSLEQKIAQMEQEGLGATHPEMKKRLKQLEALRAQLGDVESKSDRPFHGADPAAEAHAEVLRTQIAELEAQLAELSKRVTDKHDAHIRLSQRIRVLKERLAALESRRVLDVRKVVTDEDGRFVIVGQGDDTHRLRLVTGDHGTLVGRTERVVGPDGAIVEGATTLDETARRVAKRAVSLKDVWTPKRVDHLRQAAKHLREAGQTEQAERLERQATELEASLLRYRASRSGGAGSAAVLKAIGDLRQEVRALRKEVKELKALILENR